MHPISFKFYNSNNVKCRPNPLKNVKIPLVKPSIFSNFIILGEERRVGKEIAKILNKLTNHIQGPTWQLSIKPTDELLCFVVAHYLNIFKEYSGGTR